MKFLLRLLLIGTGLIASNGYSSSIAKPAPNTLLLSYSNSLTQSVPISDVSTNIATFFINNVTGLVWDVNLTTFLHHNQPGDLELYLTSPEGTRITLTSGNGSTNQSEIFNPLTWDDQALIPITDYVLTSYTNQNALAPEDALDKFYGENPQGTWQLTMIDNQPGQSGTLSNATLTITTMVGQTSTKTSFVSTGNLTNATLLDLEEKLFTLTVTNVGHYLAQVKVQTWFKHDSCSDLDVYLISPAGTFVTLTTDNGENNRDVFYGTLWDDQAKTLATEAQYTNTVSSDHLVPEGKLAAFKGENPNGIWTLQVVDDAESDQGSLEKWSLTFETSPGLITDVTGDDYADIVTYKKTSIYVIPLLNESLIGGALLAGFIPKGFTPVAVNEFTGDQQADLLLQNSTFLTIQAFSNSYLLDKAIDLGEVVHSGFKVVATTDLNQDGLVDIISQNKSELGITIAIQNNGAVHYQFRSLALGQPGKIVGANHTNLFQTIGTMLYSIPVFKEGSNIFTLEKPILLTPAFRPSFKIAGTAEFSPLSLGNEMIVQRGTTIGFGPTNLSRTLRTIYQGHGKGNIGRIIGPR